MNATAQVIVRRDRSGTDVDAHIRGLCDLAAEEHFELAGEGVQVVDSDADFPLLLAMLPLEDVGVILVPHLKDVGGWLDFMRRDYEVWTLEPRRSWPRQPCPEGGTQLLPIDPER
ncbi:hypothetical protein ACWDYH_31425 [Nocardia goodfellowii]